MSDAEESNKRPLEEEEAPGAEAAEAAEGGEEPAAKRTKVDEAEGAAEAAPDGEEKKDEEKKEGDEEKKDEEKKEGDEEKKEGEEGGADDAPPAYDAVAAEGEKGGDAPPSYDTAAAAMPPPAGGSVYGFGGYTGAASYGGGGGYGGGGTGLDDRPATKAKLEWIFAQGRCHPSEIDDKVMMSLREFPDATGVEILENFAQADLNNVRNKSAFIAGVMKRYRMGAGGVIGGPMGPTPGFSGGYGAAPSYGSGPAPTGDLPESVRNALDRIFNSGKCRPDELDSRCIDQLKTLPESTAIDVVTKFEEADLYSINSKAGFFMGIVRRFREQVVAMDPSLTSSNFATLPPALQNKLEALFSTRMVSRNELDAKCYMELRGLPEQTAMEVVDKFCESNLGEIRNKTAFFLGILKRYKMEVGGGAAYGGYAAAGYGGGWGGQQQGWGQQQGYGQQGWGQQGGQDWGQQQQWNQQQGGQWGQQGGQWGGNY